MFTGLALSVVLLAASPQPATDAATAAPAGVTAARPISHYVERSSFAPIERPAPAVQTRGGDPLKNGAIVGAVIGGLATGTFIGLLCHAVNDTADPICWKAALLWGGIGAGGGAAIGAGIDALLTRRTIVTASVRF